MIMIMIHTNGQARGGELLMERVQRMRAGRRRSATYAEATAAPP